MNFETQQAKEIFEILIDKGADMETALNILRFTIPNEKQQDKLLEIIKNDKLISPNEIIMSAIEIDEAEHPENYQ